MEEKMKEKESNRFLDRVPLPDNSGFKTSDGKFFSYDKYKGWYLRESF
jgi:hypothetical protein